MLIPFAETDLNIHKSYYAEPDSTYFRETEFTLLMSHAIDVPCRRVLDSARLIEAGDTAWRANVDLSKVDENGFTDCSKRQQRRNYEFAMDTFKFLQFP